MTEIISNLFFLLFAVGIPLWGAYKKINVYEAFTQGATEAFPLLLKILPFTLAILVALGMFRAAYGFEYLEKLLGPFFEWIGVPIGLLTQIITRPFSASASNMAMAEIFHHYGPESLIAKMAACINGSTETTFYVIAVYFGSVHIKKTRHAIPTGLAADLAGVLASVWICRWMFS